MTLSIIIPVYNTEAWLEKCVLSCLGGDAEIIIVDDGSTDGSASLARKLAGEHPGITVISQENAGPGAARNEGVRIARGEYIWFVDSDDTLEPGAVEWACRAVREHPCDYVSLSARNGGSGPLRNVLPEGAGPSEVFRSLRWLDCDVMYLWRSSFLRENGLRFREGIFFEDSELIPRALFLAGSCFVSNNPVYDVTVREGSITRSRSVKKSHDRIAVAEALLAFRDGNVSEKADRAVFDQRICVMVNRALLGMTVFGRSEKREFNAFLAGKPGLLEVFRRSGIARYRFEHRLFRLSGGNFVAVFRFLNLFKGLKA
mgnify:FL=1